MTLLHYRVPPTGTKPPDVARLPLTAPVRLRRPVRAACAKIRAVSRIRPLSPAGVRAISTKVPLRHNGDGHPTTSAARQAHRLDHGWGSSDPEALWSLDDIAAITHQVIDHEVSRVDTPSRRNLSS